MGLFDRLRKPKHGVLLQQICYDVAYFVLPHYAHNEPEKVADLWNSPDAAGRFFYLMACEMEKIESDIETAKRFRWHHGLLNEGREYFVLEYPAPPPIDLSGMSLEDLMNAASPPVLAPYFSAVIREVPEGTVNYYVLGQTAEGGGTTLRSVFRDNVNCNLGAGPEPRLANFLDAIAGRNTDA